MCEVSKTPRKREKKINIFRYSRHEKKNLQFFNSSPLCAIFFSLHYECNLLRHLDKLHTHTHIHVRIRFKSDVLLKSRRLLLLLSFYSQFETF